LLSRCDLVVEAVPENMAIKHAVIAAAEEHMPEDAVFATNTSALPINEVAKGSSRPENVIGMHYFSPVSVVCVVQQQLYSDTELQHPVFV